MAQRVLALNTNGELTYCVAPPELRGKGRCNHVDHQEDGETVPSFVERVEKLLAIDNAVDENLLPDQKIAIDRMIGHYKKSFNKNPDWEEVIKGLPNQFHIGKGDDFEEANLNEVRQEKKIDENGDPVIALTGLFEFRGKVYEADLGEVPEVQEDGSVIINGSAMRVLPVLAQHKSGLIRYIDKVVVKKSDFNLAFVYEIGSEEIKIRDTFVPLEEVEKHLNGEKAKLTLQQKKDLDMIDPIVYERFPDLKDDLSARLNEHEPDQPNDLEYRKVYTYKDQVMFELSSQMRRMGVTFRTNIAKRQKAIDSGDPEEIKKAEEFPLFFQKNNKSNILSNLAGRSNVQVADNLNPVSALSQAHKVSLTGRGGYNKDKAPTMLRQVGKSHKGVVDSLDLSSGKNIGLTITLSNSDVDERGFITKSNEKSLSPSDFIPYKHHNDLNRAAMATAHIKQAAPIVGGEDPRLLGDSSDLAWKEISGSKIGKNLRVVYSPEIKTHEDAVVLSQSAADSMKTIQTEKYKVENIKELNKFKVGQEVKKGDYLAGAKVKYGGKIKSIEGGVVKVDSEWAMRKGDKIAGRHGNKGVVGDIRPDAEMPQILNEKGEFEPAQIAMSPLGVVGRMNLGQVYETNDGDLDKKTKTKLKSGRVIESTAGTQFIMRLNHIAEKKLQSYTNERGSDREPKGLRMGEMESLLLSSSKDKLKVLDYLRNQESSDAQNKLDALMRAVGVEYKINR